MKKINYKDLTLFLEKKACSSLRLRVTRTGEIRLPVPYFCSEKRALAFFEENISWVLSRRAALNNKIRRFEAGETICLLGEELLICRAEGQRGGVWREKGRLFVSGDEAFLHRRVCDFAKKTFYAHIQERALFYAARIGEKPNHISLKNTVSRWGSCSTRKRLNFCWKLAFAPLFVSDYIAAHEAAHLKEMNHGPDFWALVGQMDVRRAEAQSWLRKNGESLHTIA